MNPTLEKLQSLADFGQAVLDLVKASGLAKVKRRKARAPRKAKAKREAPKEERPLPSRKKKHRPIIIPPAPDEREED